MTTSNSALQRPHILVITDDEDLKDFLLEGLVIGGFWVSVVASALQTLEVFRLRTFDLAIVDLALGGMSASELIRRLRAASGIQTDGSQRTDIPLVALADSPDSESAAAGLNAGADHVLSPPLELEELIPALHGIVQQWRVEHPNRPYADELAQSSGGNDPS
ncbi:MAG: response regulator transcription factor [Thermomicrobiales bacterium]